MKIITKRLGGGKSKFERFLLCSQWYFIWWYATLKMYTINARETATNKEV